MVTTSALAETAALIGDPARANMLTALMDGRALTAAELARAASVTPQTASGHLARLTAAGLLVAEKQGRHRYHCLASPGVARMLEGIMAVAGAAEGAGAIPRTVTTGPRDTAMRVARTCYDHLAGRLAVAMADTMIARGQIELSPDGGALTADGAVFLRGLGVDLAAAEARTARRGGRVFCRPCLDWSERRPHVAGAVRHGTLRPLLRPGLGTPGRGDARLDRDAERGRRSHAGIRCQVEVSRTRSPYKKT